MSDQELIKQLKEGNESAFKTIVEKWQDMVFNTCMGLVQDANDAEDVAQEVFIQVYESVEQFKGESKFSTWLYRIAVTKSLDHLRKKKRKKRFAFLQSLFGVNEEEVIQDPEFHHPGVKLENKEQAAVLFKAISKLPDNQKAAFTLHKLEGLSYQEVAEALSTTVSSVESLMHRARGNLRKILTDYYQKNNG
ncbi:MAG: RNA polymerase sigma factor [Chitinophagaceae bacterium]|nr:RNA polymerase sigma factor [Chitinophagaceae bacterium]